MAKIKRLKIGRKRAVGRSLGKVTSRHKGGGAKRLLRLVDFKRDKRGITARVEAMEHDPNRSAALARLLYEDGERRYIILPEKLKIGDRVLSEASAPAKVGNALPLGKIPVGTEVHNIELIPGRGGQLVRTAGSAAVVIAREGEYVHLKMPSGEVRRIPAKSWATIGRVAGVERKLRKLGKAGVKRHMGIRPRVRGAAQNPRSHPHGGGEGRSGIGMPGPKTPWGKPTLGKKTRKRFHTDWYIVSREKK
uniref:Large ribosomal subunit protein uL2 n=1 Tax=candidate division WWE3 bacterium TaxID=2053526 RepID=A0A831Z1C6_UNCKA